MRYIIIDADGLITNAIEWDGVTEWAPPEASTAVQTDDLGIIGGTCIDGVYAPPPTPEPVPVAPTFEQLVAQAVSFADLKALVMEQGSGA
jgi:hypothetical protein